MREVFRYGVLLLLLLHAGVIAAADVFQRGVLTENVASLSNPNSTYTLYLPSHYDEAKKWPVLLVFDPRQRGTLGAELFREPAERFGWIIVSSNQTRSDGDMQPNIEAVNALWPEIHKRYASDPRRIYAAGFSGGAILAYLLAERVPIAGIISSGGRLSEASITAPSFAHFGTAGSSDFNYVEMRDIDDRLAKVKAPHRFESFAGPHQWLSRDLAADAVLWMELVAMKNGTRKPRNDEVILRELSRATTSAKKLADEGKHLEAARAYRWIVETFDGLGDVEKQRACMNALERDPATIRDHEDEKRAFAYEAGMLANLPRTLAELDNAELPLPIGKLRADLRLDELQERAAKHDFQGEAARRVLESFSGQFGFYLHRDATSAKRYTRDILYMTLANDIKPHRPNVLYDLGCDMALTGDRKKALQFLAASVEAGFNDVEHMKNDPDLQSLRGDERFAAIVSSIH